MTDIHYHSSAWMKKINPVNSQEEYMEIGQVINQELAHTLVVTKRDGNGAAELYCETHQCIYGLREKCPECVKAEIAISN